MSVCRRFGRRSSLLLALGVAVAVGPFGSARAATTPEVHAGRAKDGHGIAVEFRAIVAAPAEEIRLALDDVGALTTWLPRLKAAQLVQSSELTDDASQVFETTMGLPWPLGDVHERVRSRQEVVGGAVRMHWDHVGGDMRRNDVVWTITPVDDKHTDLRYEATLDFSRWLPVWLLQMAERDYTPWFLYCLERRALLLVPPPSPPPPSLPMADPAPIPDEGSQKELP